MVYTYLIIYLQKGHSNEIFMLLVLNANIKGYILPSFNTVMATFEVSSLEIGGLKLRLAECPVILSKTNQPALSSVHVTGPLHSHSQCIETSP